MELSRVHPRSLKVDRARNKLAGFLYNLNEEDRLTSAEMFMILSGEMAGLSRRLVLSEREDDNEKGTS